MIVKSLAFAQAYTSGTLNSDKALLQGLNGVLVGGLVTTSSGVVTIQPLTWIQEGCSITSTTPLSVQLPAGLPRTYSVVVASAAGSVQSPLEVITPTFIVRPEDLPPNAVVVADWDGQEWRQRPQLQLAQQISAAQNLSVQEGFSGIQNGFELSYNSGSNLLTVSPGTLIDRQGASATKERSVNFTPQAQDPDDFGRVDGILYGRPDDSPVRMGVVDYVVGPVYDGINPATFTHASALGNGTTAEGKCKILADPVTGNFYYLFLQDSGARTSLIFRSAPSSYTPLSSPVTVVTGVTSFDAVINAAGNITLVYSLGDELQILNLTSSGETVQGPETVDSGSMVIQNPAIASVSMNGSYATQIVYEKVVGVNQNNLYYACATPLLDIILTASLLVNTGEVTTHASVDQDSQDLLLFVAYEDATAHRCYLATYDVSGIAPDVPPVQVGITLELQDDVLILDNDTVAPTTGASYPQVIHQKNKDTTVFFLMDRGNSTTGVGIYNPRYIQNFGHKSILPDLISSGENILLFSAAIDGFGNAHFISNNVVSTQTNLTKSSLYLYSGQPLNATGNFIDNSGSLSNLYGIFTPLGSFAFTYTLPGTGEQNNGAVQTILAFGAGVFNGESIDASEFVITQAAYDSLTYVPTLGDELTITGANDNNGTYNWLGVRSFNAGGSAYVAVSCSVSAFDPSQLTGSVQFLVEAAATLEVVKSTAISYTNPYEFPLTPTAVPIGFFRTEDQVLIESNTALGSNLDVERLYEFNAAFVSGGGFLEWNTLDAPYVLSWASSIQVQFFDRQSIYTIEANADGLTINPGYAAFVVLPDTDIPATLTLQIAPFGQGILDRSRRGTRLLFWNNGGTLYYPQPAQFANAGTTFNLNLSGGGPGLGIPYFTSKLIGIGNGTQTQFTLPSEPVNSQSVFIYASGGIVQNTLWNLINTTTVSFNVAPAIGVPIFAVFALGGQTYVTGGQEAPLNPSGDFKTYVLTGKPISQSTSFVYTNGLILNPSAWKLVIGGGGASQVILGTAVAPGTQVYVTYFNIGTAESLGAPAYDPQLTNSSGDFKTFALSAVPVSAASTFVYVGGGIVSSALWSLAVDGDTAAIVFNSAQAPGILVSALFFTPGNGGSGQGVSALANIGSGTGIFAELAGGVADLKSLIAGDNVSITSDEDSITITASASSSGGYTAYGSRGAPATLVASEGLTPGSDTLQHWFIVGVQDSGAQPVTASPPIAAGGRSSSVGVGNKLRITTVDPNDFVTFSNATGVRMFSSPSWPNPSGYVDGSTTEFSWDGTQWNQDFVNG